MCIYTWRVQSESPMKNVRTFWGYRNNNSRKARSIWASLPLWLTFAFMVSPVPLAYRAHIVSAIKLVLFILRGCFVLFSVRLTWPTSRAGYVRIQRTLSRSWEQNKRYIKRNLTNTIPFREECNHRSPSNFNGLSSHPDANNSRAICSSVCQPAWFASSSWEREGGRTRARVRRRNGSNAR